MAHLNMPFFLLIIVSHDPSIILYQSPMLADFLVELFKQFKPPYESSIEKVRNDQLYNIWRTNPGVLTHNYCMASSDKELRSFAGALDSTFQFISSKVMACS